MIHAIYSSDPAFKRLDFHPGFNALIAEKGKGATDLQTRNRAGKSSFVRLVHFLTGGSCDKGKSMFLDPALRPHTFGMTFDLGGDKITVERSASQPSRVFFPKEPTKPWPLNPKRRRDDRRFSLSNEEWKAVLGSVMFGLRAASDEGGGWIEKQRDQLTPERREAVKHIEALIRSQVAQDPHAEGLRLRMRYLDEVRKGADGDADFVAAVEGAPKSFALIDAETRQQADDVRVEISALKPHIDRIR